MKMVKYALKSSCYLRVAVTHQNCVREEIKNNHDRRALAGII